VVKRLDVTPAEIEEWRPARRRCSSRTTRSPGRTRRTRISWTARSGTWRRRRRRSGRCCCTTTRW
jgi:hypothetical protein